MASNLTRAQYSGLDFDTISDDLRAQLQVQFAANFNDFVASSQGIMMLDLVAFGLDTLSFYLDRRATDTYLATARTRKAVARLTRQLGYKMGAAVSASTDLDVTIPVYPFNVKLQKGFKFKGPNDLVFETAQEIVWAPGDVVRKKRVPVYEGETFTESFVSDGTANQVFELRRVPVDKYVVAGTVQVLVNGSEFSESDFISFDLTDQFEVGYNDNPPTVRFGDGVAGRIPTVGATISVTYIAARGKAGIVSKGSIQKELDPLVVNFQTISLTVNNPVGTTGGDDPEDLNHAKIYAGKVFKSRQVAVTREDYEALAGSFADPLFGRVAVAQAISSRSADTDTELANNTSTIRTAQTGPAGVAGAGGTAITAANTKLTDIDSKLAAMSTTLGEVVTKVEAVATTLGTVTTTARSARDSALEAGAQAGDASSDLSTANADLGTVSASLATATNQLTDASTVNLAGAITDLGLATTAPDGLTALMSQISAIAGGGGADQFQNATKTSIQNKISYISGDVATILTLVTLAKTLVDNALGNVSTAKSNADTARNLVIGSKSQVDSAATKIGTISTTADTLLTDAQTALSTVTDDIGTALDEGLIAELEASRFAIVTDIGSTGPEGTGVKRAIYDITNAVTGAATDVEDALAAIEAHVDKILSADCKANLVTVPILARDAAGFFTAPSSGLIHSLQTFLDARKEVTQTVQVTSGANSLVSAAVIARVGVLPGYSLSVVEKAAEAVIDTLLRDRKFGASLFVSDVIQAVLAVDGVDYVNVLQLFGAEPGPLDEEGNLIIADSQVITKGSVTINAEASVD